MFISTRTSKAIQSRAAVLVFVDTKVRVEHGKGLHPEDTWYAWLKGKWVRIQPKKIVPDYAPDGLVSLRADVL